MTTDNKTTPKQITMTYRNYRGEVSQRTILPKDIWFGTTEWHPEPGWLLSGIDLEKEERRDFALADCQFANLSAPSDAVERLRAALKPFAEAEQYCDPAFDDDYAPRWAEFFTLGDFRRARAALAQKGGE